VHAFFHAVSTFFGHLAAVSWTALAIAVACHCLRLLSRVPAWRNILRASYPGVAMPWRAIYGSYIAGVGINSIIPARAGDLLKLYLVKHRVPETNYPTLGATLLVETLFDMLVAGGILIWALVIGVLPSLQVTKIDLTQVDWSWPLRHPLAATLIGIVWFVTLVILIVWATRRARAFKERVRQGFAILRSKVTFLRQVVTWQALSWLFRGVSVFFFLRAFHVDATVYNVMLVLAVQSISTLLPITPGGAGTQQGFLVYVFSRAEPLLSRTAVLSFSVGMFVTVTVVQLVLGFAAILAMLGTLRWRQLVRPDGGAGSPRRPSAGSSSGTGP
jgi:uncharacterized membrane protein YbhN (UPF0104 family)